MLAWRPIVFFTEKAMLAVSRRNEFQADRYAEQFDRGSELVSGLVNLFKENKSSINPHPL